MRTRWVVNFEGKLYWIMQIMQTRWEYTEDLL